MDNSQGAAISGPNATSLLTLLSNPLIFDHTCANLTIGTLLRLSATSRPFHTLIHTSRTAFRYLDLSTTKGASVNIAPIDRGGELWRNERIDEGVTEEDFYSGPLRGIFSSLRRKQLLDSVATLVLDGTTAPAEVLHEVICSGRYAVRILSLRGAKHLNEIKLRKSLGYAVRPTRPEGSPALRGLYIFGAAHLSLDPATPAGITVSVGAQLGGQHPHSHHRQLHHQPQSAPSAADLHAAAEHLNPWYSGRPGRVIAQSKRLDDWALTVLACRGIVAFDAVLCQGPRHHIDVGGVGVDAKAYIDPAIASVVLRGCVTCHSAPEGPVSTKEAPSERLPLLEPLPRYSTSIAVAQRPWILPPPLGGTGAGATGGHNGTNGNGYGSGRWGREQLLFARCTACLLHRCCEGCFKFWCEDCHDGEIAGRGDNPDHQGTKRACWECGRLCHDCNTKSERVCRSCNFPFCMKHADGSTLSTCDWCQYSRRRGREMY